MVRGIPPGASHIVRTLRGAGHQAVLAGGCVRDLLLGRDPADFDIATDADPAAVAALFPRTTPVGVRFGILLVHLEDGDYEVARFRRDGPYLDGRHPDRVTFTSAEEDARRRDFTINGMFLDPLAASLESGVTDHVGGRADLRDHLVRAIGFPVERFGEDHLRLLRAPRFAARLGFEIEAGTAAAISGCAAGLSRISPERVRDELTGLLTEGQPRRGLELLLDLGLLRQVLPEVADMVGVGQPPEHHPEGDVWTHTLIMLDEATAAAPEGKLSPVLAWAILLHDVGKPPTYQEADRIRFNNHDEVGAEMVEAIGARLRLPNALVDEVRELTAQHMRFRHVRDMRRSKLVRFLRQAHFEDLLELHRVDCLASHGKLDLYDFCRAERAAAGEEKLRPPRLVTGHDLIALGGQPGPHFGDILEALEDEQLEGTLGDRDQALARARALLAAGSGGRAEAVPRTGRSRSAPGAGPRSPGRVRPGT